MTNTLFAQRHAFHLVDPSALPLLTSIGALCLTSGSVLYFHGYTFGLESTLFGFFCVLVCFLRRGHGVPLRVSNKKKSLFFLFPS